ncbi:hypothetical protein Tco_0424618, partial [Tanacetum coccineum]
ANPADIFTFVTDCTNHSEKIEEVMTEIKTKTTMEEFVTKNRTNYYSGITNIMVNGKAAYELKGKFLDDLHENAFSGTNGEDAVEHIEYFLKIVDPIDMPNVNHERIRLAVFPISLKYYPPSRTYKVYNQEGVINDGFSDLEKANNDDEYKINGKNKWPTCNSNEDGFCNGGELPRMVQEKEEQHKEGRCDLFDDLAQELSVCKMRRFEMIKYSFGQEEEYVAVKEYEYNDLTRTNEDACHAY